MALLNNLGQKLSAFFGEDSPLDPHIESTPITSDFLNPNILSELLPYRLYDSEHKIYENKSCLGFVLEVVPLLGATEETEQELSTLIREIGEEGASIQCLLWSDHRIDQFSQNWEVPRDQKGSIYKTLAQKRIEFLKKEALTGESPPRIFRCFISYSMPKLRKKERAQELQNLISKKKKALATLSRLSYAADLEPEAFLATFSGLINFELNTQIDCRKKWNRQTWLANQLCLPGGAIEVKENVVEFKGKEAASLRTYEAVDYPDHWGLWMTGELIGDFFNQSYRIATPFYLHYGIHFPTQAKEEEKFRGKEKMLDHQCKFPGLIRMFPNMPREREENHYVLRQLLEGEKFIETRLSVGLFAQPERLLKEESTLLSLFQKYGFKLKENRFLHLPDFLSSLPMSWGESSPHIQDLKRTRTLRTTLTQETGQFMPIVAEWWGNSKEGMILTGRKGQIAAWDPFASEGNLNAVVIGPSGSGKSVFMQEMITSHLGQGGRVFVLDLGRSYEKLCHLLGGQYLAFSEGSGFNLNPFGLIQKRNDLESINTALEMVASIVATMAMPQHKMDKERSDILSSIVRQAWEQKGSQTTIDDIISQLETSQYQSELMRGAIESLKEGLQKFSQKGTYSNYFYGEKDVNLKNDLVVIETEELKTLADLQAVILQIFTLTISNQIFQGNREQKCMICIDEAWDLLKSPQMEGFIESLARRLRKYNGSLIVGTQGLKDFECSPGARAAFQNSNWLLMLGKDNDSINILKKENLIQMNEQTERVLGSLRKEDGKYSEVFIYHKGSGFQTLAQLKLDPFSQMLFSTKAEDFKVLKTYQKQGCSIEGAIEKMVSHT